MKDEMYTSYSRLTPTCSTVFYVFCLFCLFLSAILVFYGAQFFDGAV